MNWQNFGSLVNDAFFVLMTIMLLQPAIKRGMLNSARTGLLQQIEKKRKSRVIALVHRTETMNLFGFPVMQFIDIQDAEQLLRAIRLTPDTMPIDIILHTPAGLSLAAEQVARALRRHPAKITVFVPHYAMSGGTLIALAADQLVMCRDAVLGALDPIIGQYPAASLVTIAEKKNVADISDATYLQIEQAKKAIQQTRATTVDLLTKRMPKEDAERLAGIITSGSHTQDYPIGVDELQAIGMNVTEDMPLEVFQFMNLFPQQTNRRPSVDFIPLPYTNPPSAPPPVAPAP